MYHSRRNVVVVALGLLPICTLLLPGHELQGLINYFNCNIEGLTVPLGSSLSTPLRWC
jgi:hypothetical protein